MNNNEMFFDGKSWLASQKNGIIADIIDVSAVEAAQFTKMEGVADYVVRFWLKGGGIVDTHCDSPEAVDRVMRSTMGDSGIRMKPLNQEDAERIKKQMREYYEGRNKGN